MAFEESLTQLKSKVARKPYMGKVEFVAITLLCYLGEKVDESAIPYTAHGALEFSIPTQEGFWHEVSGLGRELVIRHRTSGVSYDPMAHLQGFKEYLIREANLIDIPSDVRSELVAAARGLTARCKSHRPRTGISQYRLIHEREGGMHRLNTVLGRVSKLIQPAVAVKVDPPSELAVAEFLAKRLSDDEHVLLINAITSYRASNAEKECLGRVLDKVFPNHNIEVAPPPKTRAYPEPGVYSGEVALQRKASV